MGTHDKDTRKERKAKKKKKEGQAYKAESGLYKKSEFYKKQMSAIRSLIK